MQYGNIRQTVSDNKEPCNLWSAFDNSTCTCFMDKYNHHFGFCPIDSFSSEALHVSPSELAGLPCHADYHGQSRMPCHRQNGNRYNYPIRTVMDRNKRSQMATDRSPMDNDSFQSPPIEYFSQKQFRDRQRKKRVKFWGDFEGAKKPPAREIAIFTKNSRVGEGAKISYV